jgi:DNA-binding response OmpR family regulator
MSCIVVFFLQFLPNLAAMKKVLIIDDDVDSLTAVTKLLGTYAFKVRGLSETEEVLQTVKEYRPHIIILDINLGRQDGRNICRQLKSNTETGKIKIILYSGYYDASDNYREYNADDFIAKPFVMKQLVNKMQQHLTIV